jgi:hypothetical protein
MDWFKMAVLDDIKNDHEDETGEKLSNSAAIQYMVSLMDDLYSEYLPSNFDFRKFWTTFFETNKKFISYINSIFEPNENGFELITVGADIPSNNEVWSDGDALLVLDNDTKSPDDLLKKV